MCIGKGKPDRSDESRDRREERPSRELKRAFVATLNDLLLGACLVAFMMPALILYFESYFVHISRLSGQ
jgi:hypothetical protein